MNWLKFLDMFKDDTGKPSAVNYGIVMGVTFLSIVITVDSVNGKTSEGVIAIFAGLIAALAGIKKGFESSVQKASINSTAAPPVTVNNIENADSLTKTGTVNVDNSK